MDIGTACRILKTVVNFLEGLDHETICEDCVEEKNSLFRRVEKFLKMNENDVEISVQQLKKKNDQAKDVVIER